MIKTGFKLVGLAVCCLLASCAAREWNSGSRAGLLGWRGPYPSSDLEQLRVIEGALSDPVPVTVHPDSEFDLSSFEQKQLGVFISERSGNWDVWAQPLDGAPPQRIVGLPSRESQPAVSPDGEWVAFVSDYSDEHGDIHRVRVEPNATLDQLARSGRKRDEQLVRLKSIESSPRWLSDEVLAFTSRTSEGWRLMAHDWDEERTWQLSNSEVREFSVFTDDFDRLVLAYVSGGTIWVGRLESLRASGELRGEAVSSANSAVLEGFPSWDRNEQGSTRWLYYARWIDDTNLDGLVSVEDNPSLWRVAVDVSGRRPEPVGPPEPLTGGEAYDVSPVPTQSGLYFVRQLDTGVGIVRLPLGGRAAGLSVHGSQLNAVQEWSSPYDRLLGYRWIRRHARENGNRMLEMRCTFEIAEEFEALENLGQAFGAYDELSRSDEGIWARRAQLALVRLEARILSAAALGEQTDKVVRQELAGYARRLREIAGKADARLGAEALLTLARIQQQFQRPIEALESIGEIERHYAAVPDVVSRARMVRADIYRARGDDAAFRQELLNITQDYSDFPTIRERAVRRFLGSIEEEESDPKALVQQLRQVMAQHTNVALLQSLGALRIARAYRRLGLPHAHEAELHWVIDRKETSDMVQSRAIEQLLLKRIDDGTLDEVEKLETRYLEQAPSTLPEKELQAAQARIVEALLERASGASDRGERDNARAVYEYVSHHHPSVLEGHYGRVSLAESSEREALRDEYEGQNSSAAHYALALLLLKESDPDLGDILEEHVEPALREYATDPAVHQLRGFIFQMNETVYRQRGVGGIEQAIQAYQLALILSNAAHEQQERRQELYLALGNAFISFTPPNYERADYYYNRFLELGTWPNQAQRELALRERMARAAFHNSRSREAAHHAGRGAVLAGSLGRAALQERLLAYEAMCLQEAGAHQESVARWQEVERAPGGRRRSVWRNLVLRNLAYNRYQNGELIDALDNLHEGFEILQDDSIPFDTARARTRGFSTDASEDAFGFSRQGELRLNYTFTGQIREELGHLGRAAELQRQKLALFPKPDNERSEEGLKYHNRLGIGWNRVARLEYERGRLGEVTDALDRSLASAALSRQSRGQALALTGLLRASLESDAPLEERRIVPLQEGLSRLIGEGRARRARGVRIDAVLLSRLYHARALLRMTSTRNNVSDYLKIIEDFSAAAYHVSQTEHGSHASEELSIKLNELSFLHRIGFTKIAKERSDQLGERLESQGLHCLAWHLPLSDARLSDDEERALLESLHATPPALCAELSKRQLRSSYERIFEWILDKAVDPTRVAELLELRSQLILAAELAGQSYQFANPEEQEMAVRIERVLDEARSALVSLQNFRIVEGSLENREQFLGLREKRRQSMAALKVLLAELRGSYPALTRLYAADLPTQDQVVRALEGAALLRFTKVGERVLLYSQLPEREPQLRWISPLPGKASAEQFDLWVAAALAEHAVPLRRSGSVYVIADGELAGFDWARLGTALGSTELAVSQVVSLAHLTLAWQRRNANKGRGILVARTDALSDAQLSQRYAWLEKFHADLAQQITGLRGFYFRDNTAMELAQALSDPTAQYHFLQVFAPLELTNGVPLAGALELWSPVAGNSLALVEWTRMRAQSNLAIFANVRGSLDGTSLPVLGYLSAFAGMPSVVLVRRHERFDRPPGSELRAYQDAFARVLPDEEGRYERAVAAASVLRQRAAFADHDVRFIGYLGMDNLRASAYSQERLNQLASATVTAVQDGRMQDAAAGSEQAIILMDVVGVPAQNLLEMLNVAVFTHKKAGMLRRATKYEERQVRLLERAGVSEALVRILFFLGRDQRTLGDYEQAAANLVRSRDYAQRIDRADLELVVLSELARAREASGDPRRAIEHYEAGLALAQSQGDKAGEEEFHYNIGRVAHTRLHDETRAARHLNAALNLARELGEGARRNAARDALTLVLVEQQRGRLTAALETLDDLLPWAQQLGDRELLSQGMVYQAIIQRRMGDLTRAEEILRRAERVAREVDAAQVLADVRNARVLVRLDQGRLEEARALAQELTGESLATEAALAAFHNLALVTLELGDLDVARAALERAQWHAARVGEPLAIADELLLEARLLRARPEYRSESLEKLAQAAQAYKQAAHPARELECRVAALEWGEREPDLAALLGQTQALARDDLRWRVLMRMGRLEEAAQLYLASAPTPDAVLERRGLDPRAGSDLMREYVGQLAARGHEREAMVAWERARARRRWSLIAGLNAPLHPSRGGDTLVNLVRIWAEIRALRIEPRPDEAALAGLQGKTEDLLAELGRTHPASAAYLSLDDALVQTRLDNLREGDRFLSVVSAAARTWFFFAKQGELRVYSSAVARSELSNSAARLGELLSSMARYDKELATLRDLLPAQLMRDIQHPSTGRVLFVPDAPLQGLPMQLVFARDGKPMPVAYRASLAPPLYERGTATGRPLSVLALGEMPAARAGRKLPPRTEKRPSPWQDRLWDQEIFELLEVAAIGRYVTLTGTTLDPWQLSEPHDALWCAARSVPGRRGGGLCGGHEGTGLALKGLANAPYLPSLVMLPGFSGSRPESQDLALWLEWAGQGAGVIFGTERLPVSGASYGKYLVRALAAGQPRAAAHRGAREKVRARWPHPAHWAGFLYYGAMD